MYLLIQVQFCDRTNSVQHPIILSLKEFRLEINIELMGLRFQWGGDRFRSCWLLSMAMERSEGYQVDQKECVVAVISRINEPWTVDRHRTQDTSHTNTLSLCPPALWHLLLMAATHTRRYITHHWAYLAVSNTRFGDDVNSQEVESVRPRLRLI